MIMTRDFVWLHFPKCAGTEVAAVLEGLRIPGAACDPIDPANVIWHHTIAQRQAYDPGFSVAGREIICCFRRLPNWLLSRVYFEFQRSGLIPTREMFVRGQFYDINGVASNADYHAGGYSPGVTRWIRTEHLVEDFVSAFSPHVDLAGVDAAALFTRRNATAYPHVKRLEFYFTQAELDGLYATNPVWAGLEAAIYGGLARLGA